MKPTQWAQHWFNNSHYSQFFPWICLRTLVLEKNNSNKKQNRFLKKAQIIKQQSPEKHNQVYNPKKAKTRFLQLSDARLIPHLLYLLLTVKQSQALVIQLALLILDPDPRPKGKKHHVPHCGPLWGTRTCPGILLVCHVGMDDVFLSFHYFHCVSMIHRKSYHLVYAAYLRGPSDAALPTARGN